MIVCPVCENQQAQGTACDVCGVPFPKGQVATLGHRDPPVVPMEGLETTAVVAPGAASVVPAVTANSPCVWCKHVQPSGLICDRCGMQRHRGGDPGLRGGRQGGGRRRRGVRGSLPGLRAAGSGGWALPRLRGQNSDAAGLKGKDP